MARPLQITIEVIEAFSRQKAYLQNGGFEKNTIQSF